MRAKRSALSQQVTARHQQTDVHESITKQDRNNINDPQKKHRLSLNAGQKYCRMLQESILQYFGPSLSYHLSLKPLFCLFLSDQLRQVLLYL